MWGDFCVSVIIKKFGCTMHDLRITEGFFFFFNGVEMVGIASSRNAFIRLFLCMYAQTFFDSTCRPNAGRGGNNKCPTDTCHVSLIL